MKVFYDFIVILVVSFSFGCASTPPQPTVPRWAEAYYAEIKQKIEPLWRKNTEQEIKKLLNSGLSVQQLGSPENTVKLELNIDQSGKIENVQMIQISKYRFFNKVALNTIKKIESLPPPPAECFKEKWCTFRWAFVLATQ